MKLFVAYLKQRRRVILAAVLSCVVFAVSFALYRLPIRAVLYPTILCLTVVVAFSLFDFQTVRRKHQRLEEMKRSLMGLIESLPPPVGIEEQDYQEIIRLMYQQQNDLEALREERFRDMTDYYTVWAHQIKTPIASMRLHLQNEDTNLSRQLMNDLSRIEQYVEMVLVFLRLDAETTDYVFAEHDLDTIIRGAIRKFSGEFIARRLKLEYEPLHTKVLTDEKWLSFVVEQVLSNALKYTREGTISICLEESKTLCIRDTGMGIAPEDLPRIFQKGYTGYHGRRDKRASGLGLYLCRRVCRNLNHRILASSVLGQGTEIRIDLSRDHIMHE